VPQSWREFGQLKFLDSRGYGVTQWTAMLTNCEVSTASRFDERHFDFFHSNVACWPKCEVPAVPSNV